MTMKRPSDFVRLAYIAQVTDPKVLRYLLTRAEIRVSESEYIGWPALAASWQGDVDAIRRRMAELQVPPGASRDRRERGRAAAARKTEEVCA